MSVANGGRRAAIGTDTLPRYLWHEHLHRKLCNERLVYMRLGFKPAYDRALAIEQIKSTFKSLNIVSYTLWEMFGDADILLRAWLPSSVESLDSLRRALEVTITGPHRPSIQVFQVDAILYHHLWQSKVDLLTARRDIKREHYSAINSEVYVPRAEVNRYLDAGYLTSAPYASLLKFFTIVTPADLQSRQAVYEISDFEQSLLRLVSGVEHITSLALYGGNGMGNYLISGRIGPSRFEALSTELNDKINKLGKKYAGIRTITWLSAFAKPVDQREELSFPGSSDAQLAEEDPPVLSELLSAGETQRIEVKGSAFSDLKPSIDHGVPALEQPYVIKSLAKAVVGLLNADGGHVIVGVLEAADFQHVKVKTVLPFSVKLDDFIVVGVEHEYPARRKWDGYLSKLRQKLGVEITPNPDSWLEYLSVDHEGLRCCVISVHRPDEWFWAKEDLFYVRFANGTRRLSGPEQLRYIRSHPR